MHNLLILVAVLETEDSPACYYIGMHLRYTVDLHYTANMHKIKHSFVHYLYVYIYCILHLCCECHKHHTFMICICTYVQHSREPKGNGLSAHCALIHGCVANKEPFSLDWIVELMSPYITIV